MNPECHFNARRPFGRAAAIACAALFTIGAATLPALADDGASQEVEPQEKQVSPKEMKSRSSKSIEQMKKALSVILSRLEEARKSKDAVKMNCVNDRLTDVKGMLRISEQADVALQEALANNELAQAAHSLGTVEANARKVNQLAAECDQCIGMLAFDTEGTKLTVEEPSDTGDWSPDDGSGDSPATSGGSRPVSASPVE